LAEYEADRDIVKERVRREKVSREAREQKAKEAAEAAARGEEDQDQIKQEVLTRGANRLDGVEGNEESSVNYDEEDDDEDDDDDGEMDEDETYARYMRKHGEKGWGSGQALGGRGGREL
jgi:hypothetical protein